MTAKQDESVAGQPTVDPRLRPVVASSPDLAGERVAFTGTLASMTHQQAHEAVAAHGGLATHHVSRQTTILVVGEEGWPLEPDGRPSVKLQQVIQLQEEGLPVRILRESEWLRLLGLDDRRRDVQSLYTPAMLCQSLKVPIGTIRRWERLGLIRPIKKVFRLPYFDFEEAACVRRLNEFLEAGISRSELESSLLKLRNVLPGIDRPLAQLNLLAGSTRVLIRDGHGPLEPTSGQRCFDFFPQSAAEPDETSRVVDSASSTIPFPSRTAPGDGDRRTRWTAEQWFDEGCSLLDSHEAAGAIEAFRLALMERPGRAEIHFHLAEALFRMGNRDGALERYFAAVETDPNYIEAWTQIGCVQAERGESQSALEAFGIALSLHGDYPDAHWHIADLLMQLGREDEAADHWRKYLDFDSRGPWADQARERLASIESKG